MNYAIYYAGFKFPSRYCLLNHTILPFWTIRVVISSGSNLKVETTNHVSQILHTTRLYIFLWLYVSRTTGPSFENFNFDSRLRPCLYHFDSHQVKIFSTMRTMKTDRFGILTAILKNRYCTLASGARAACLCCTCSFVEAPHIRARIGHGKSE